MQILSSEHLKYCQFAVNRYQALKKLGTQERIAEIGVLAGDLSDWFIKNLNPSEIHMIDLYNCADFPGRDRFTKRQHEQFVKDRFKKEIEEGRAVMKKGISWDVMAHYPNNYFNLIYIDAAHDYISVKKDLESSVNKVMDGGYIVMNDYIMYDHLANTKYGVVQATNDFCIKHGWEFLYFAFHPNLFCDVVLRKIQ